MSQKIILGVDAGGTKTLCAALCRESLEIHTAVGGPSNYQSIGIESAVAVWSDVVRRALAPMGASTTGLVTAGLGIAGLDRPKDRATILAGWKRVVGEVPLQLVNDAYLALRAGTTDGVGVAVVSGTGCNAMGTNAAGKRFRVGGVGPEFGDLGSASDIGVEAMKASFRSLDGRGPQTALVEMLCSRLGLDRLDDMVDFFLADNMGEDAAEQQFGTGALAPLVFEAAGKADEVSVNILRWAGQELGQSARAVARQLFATNEAFALVMGGSVLQKASTQHLKEALLRDVSTEFTGFVPVTLDLPPVAGALLYALDLAAGRTSDASQGKLAPHYETVRAMKTIG